MKPIIIYYSKTGFTQQYAEWLSEALNCTCIPYAERKELNLMQYDTILFGGPFHAGKIKGIQWLKSLLPKLQAKRIIVFATGACPDNFSEIKQAFSGNFTSEELQKIATFYLQSGLAYEKMGLGAKMMMSAFRKMLTEKKDKTPEEENMAVAIAQSFDCSDKSKLQPIIHYIQQSEH